MVEYFSTILPKMSTMVLAIKHNKIRVFWLINPSNFSYLIIAIFLQRSFYIHLSIRIDISCIPCWTMGPILIFNLHIEWLCQITCAKFYYPCNLCAHRHTHTHLSKVTLFNFRRYLFCVIHVHEFDMIQIIIHLIKKSFESPK